MIMCTTQFVMTFGMRTMHKLYAVSWVSVERVRDILNTHVGNMPELSFLIEGHFAIRGTGEKYGRGTGDILLDNIICSGNETSLLKCDHNPLRENNCASDHSEDAAVICGGMCTQWHSRSGTLWVE